MASYHVQKLKERLIALEAVRDNIEANGQNISLTGAWSSQFADYNKIIKEIKKIEGRIAQANGASPVLTPIYTDSSVIKGDS
jgi:hypothetical protein